MKTSLFQVFNDAVSQWAGISYIGDDLFIAYTTWGFNQPLPPALSADVKLCWCLRHHQSVHVTLVMVGGGEGARTSVCRQQSECHPCWHVNLHKQHFKSLFLYSYFLILLLNYKEIPMFIIRFINTVVILCDIEIRLKTKT